MKTRLALACALACASLSPAFAVTPADYGMTFTVTVGDAVGDKTATDAVVPIRLAMGTTGIAAFDYADFQQSDGTDLLITDDNDNALSYEIDLWNPDGTTTLWVKVPTIAAGTVLHVYYKGARNTDNVPASVWSRFLGVWHFNEESVNGTRANAYDASGHNRTGIDTPKTTSVAGLFGLARQPRDSNSEGANGNTHTGGVFLPAIALNGQFAISGCFKVLNPKYNTLFSTKDRGADGPGFWIGRNASWGWAGLEFTSDNQPAWNTCNCDLTPGEWNHYCFVMDGSYGHLYQNGVYKSRGNKGSITISDNGNRICVGNVSCPDSATEGSYFDNGSSSGWSLIGQMDEIRIRSYADFDENREYFEDATMKDASLLQYSAASASADLPVEMSFRVLNRFAPAKVEYTAIVTGGAAPCTYSWDFDSDGVVDAVVTGGNIITNTFTIPGKYHPTVSVVDNANVTGVLTLSEFATVNGTWYVDSTAGNGGVGFLENDPFDNLANAFAAANDGDSIKLSGTLAIGEDDNPLTLAASNVTISPWHANQRAKLSATTLTARNNALAQFSGDNISLIGMDVEVTKESFKKDCGFLVAGNEFTVEDCSFELMNPDDSDAGKSGIVGVSSLSVRGLTVKDCSFKNFAGGNRDFCVLRIAENATVVGCTFDTVSRVLNPNGNTGGGLYFVSNIVLNAQCTSLTGDASGALVRGGWGRYSGTVFAFNRFVNNTKGGCVISLTSKTGQNGFDFYNNTVVGYEALTYSKGTVDPYTFRYFNNILADADYILNDEDATASYGRMSQSVIRNNAYFGQMVVGGSDSYMDVIVPAESGGKPKLLLTDNIKLDSTPRFLSMSRTSPNFMGVSAGSTSWIYSAWTNDGAYPAYIGAVDPSTLQLSTLILFR